MGRIRTRDGMVFNWRPAVTGLLAGVMAVSGSAVGMAQESSPEVSPEEAEALDVSLVTPEGDEVGVVSFHQEVGLDAVSITGDVEGLEPGEHGFHIHETGACDPSGDTPFESAGGHFNPTDASHGPGPMMDATPSVSTPVSDADEAHAGDLGNITAGEDGSATISITTDRVSLVPDQENSLSDEDGSALVVHAGADDLQTDPSGDSGDRVACGVIFPPQENGDVPASPIAREQSRNIS